MRFLVQMRMEFSYLKSDGKIPDIYKEFATMGIYDKSRKTKTAKRAQKRKQY